MPTEDRRILFDNEEVYKAIYGLCAQRQMKKPPSGILKEVTEDQKDQNKIYLVIENPQEETKSKPDYSRDFLAASLLLFCRSLQIPIPKGARKSVVIDEGTVILHVQVG